MIAVSYYPGCSLHGMAAEYDESIRAVCRALGVELAELPDWNCCGASSAHFLSDELAFRLSARNMRIAEQQGRDLLVPCAACFQRLKHADKALRQTSCTTTEPKYNGRVEVFHVNDFFCQPEILGRLRQRVARPLGGLAGVAYYGCLSQRPPKVTDAPRPENPIGMDVLMRSVGMTVCRWSYKTDCCGGSLAVARTDLVHKLTGDLLAAAAEAGAECIVTDCPMCQSNLDTRQAEIEAQQARRYDLPVFYITELLALALGAGEPARWWRKHLVDPAPLLRRKGLC